MKIMSAVSAAVEKQGRGKSNIKKKGGGVGKK